MASTYSVLRRALLYVPASSSKFLQKSIGLEVDCVAYDLEDSVSASSKASARRFLRDFLANNPRPQAIREIGVRINSVESGLAQDDLQEVLQAPNLDVLVIPKVRSASDLKFVADFIGHKLPNRQKQGVIASASTPSDSQARPPLRIIALIESALALQNLPSICTSTPYLDGLIFGAEDFAYDLSLTRTPSLTEFLYARSHITTTARAFNIPNVIDLVCTSYKPPDGESTLRIECEDGRQMGFNGKQCIHPLQVPIVQEAFAPTEVEITWAIRVSIADEKAVKSGRGAWGLNGKMVDAPVVKKARTILENAEKAGRDLSTLRKKWAVQEPE